MYKRKLTDEEINAIRRNINEEYYREVAARNSYRKRMWQRTGNYRYYDWTPGYDVETGEMEE